MFDESGFSIPPNHRYIWMKRNEVHFITAIRSKRIHVMGYLLSTGQLMTSCLEGLIASVWFY